MKHNQIFALKTTGILIGISLASFLVFAVHLGIVGKAHQNLVMMNPAISGFLHASVDHFLTNIIILGLCLLPAINQHYDWKRIFWITTFLSILYLPISASGITQPAVGLSGTWFFLATRFFLTWEKRKNLGQILAALLAIMSLHGLATGGDGVAHLMHLLGSTLGFLSLNREKLSSIFPQWAVKQIA